ncbi:MAG: serine hydrolase domain-containing protein [Cyclobacteriaceae bacterium]
MTRFSALFLLVLVFACQPKAEQRAVEETASTKYQSTISQARAMVNELMKENETPGMAVAVSVNGETVWSEGFGYADVENKVEVNPRTTMFRIGSVSKTLTASAIGLLMEQGKLDVLSTIQSYVSDFPEKKYPITVKQVAGHIGGVRHYKGNEMMSDVYYPTVKEGLEIFSNDDLLFEPGTDYSYSSYGWNLISAVIESASGEDFLLYMQKNIFDPLGMVNTTADIAINDIKNRTKFYVRRGFGVADAPYVDNSYKWAGGGFIGSAEDLILFGNAHLSGGFLSQESLDAIQKSQVLANGEATNYGMGWASRTDKDGRYRVGHSGGSVGGITQFVTYPKEKVVVAMVSNCSPLRYNGIEGEIGTLFIETSEQK